MIGLKRYAFNILWIWGCFYFASNVHSTVSANVMKRYPKTLPVFSLKDPSDKTYVSKLLAKKGLVLVVTAPIQSNESDQKGWDEQLRNAKNGHAGHLVFLKDMIPSSFRKIAINQMEKSYRPGVEPILLLDHDGKVRSSLKVEEKATVVLVYNAKRRLVYAEVGPPSAASAEKVWKALK